jgi:hypothetical protein
MDAENRTSEPIKKQSSPSKPACPVCGGTLIEFVPKCSVLDATRFVRLAVKVVEVDGRSSCASPTRHRVSLSLIAQIATR